MKLLSYDIEIYNEFPTEGEVDLADIIPSVAAIGTNKDDVEFFDDIPYMTKETACRLVNAMMDKYKQGYIPFTWNGLSFDFQLLGKYSGMLEECGILALNSIDGMFIVVANKGFFLGLDKALIGFNLETKRHKVNLNDGTEVTDMSGAKAPAFWRDGEYQAVKDYLYVDVVQPLALAEQIEKQRCIKWTSNAGKPMYFSTPLKTVLECLKMPEVDTSWMTNPKPRSEFYSWIPENIQNKYIHN
jgi:hypothetical protein